MRGTIRLQAESFRLSGPSCWSCCGASSRAWCFPPDNSVAFNLAIYEIVYDGNSLVFDANGFLVPGQDLTGGEFDGSDGGSARWAIAESWLYALDLNGSSTGLIAWHSDDYHDQIVEEHFHPVPVEETTWGYLKSMYEE
jgi:hypothetical protein